MKTKEIINCLTQLKIDADQKAIHEEKTTNSKDLIAFYNGLATAYDNAIDIIREELEK